MIRSEEEKTQDMILYEKKAKAADIVEKYDKAKRKSNIAAAVAAIVCVIASYSFFYKAYDTEELLAMALIILAVVLVIFLAKTITGAIAAKVSPIKLLRLGSLCTKWRDARKEMHRLEEKYADQTAFADDVTKAEHRLLRASDALIEFAGLTNLE